MLCSRGMRLMRHLPHLPEFGAYPARDLHRSPTMCKTVPSNLKGKSKPAQDWLTRQVNDPYVKKSRYENYRARSAYKLIEIDDRYSILKPGMLIVECGAAPGSWTQVAVQRVNAHGKMEGSRGLPTPPQGTVIALDLVPFESVPHATCLSQMNILSDECTLRLTTLLMEHSVRAGVGPSGCIDVILSDMAPSTTGHKDMDHDKIIKLCYAALKFSVSHLTTGGTFLCKLWHGRRERDLHQDLENLFEEVRYVKPPASRDDSSEVYLLAKKFRGIKRTHEPPVGGAKAPIDAAEAEENR